MDCGLTQGLDSWEHGNSKEISRGRGIELADWPIINPKWSKWQAESGKGSNQDSWSFQSFPVKFNFVSHRVFLSPSNPYRVFFFFSFINYQPLTLSSVTVTTTTAVIFALAMV
ncbi:hypothetical protein K445DRAFT_315755 [Daldinia sp. EC12]|nr:hypothetical protein K445DRAFT_315755 [Daldinia sp. EC12]